LKKFSIKEAEDAMQRRGKIAEQLISSQCPELLSLFVTYQNEALAARRLLHPNLLDLRSGSEILEIGGGIVALATQLSSEGFRVTSVEPVGEGFTGISVIMRILLDMAKEEGLELNLIQAPIEECSFIDNFDFIFSINVMEHLSDPYSVLLQMENALKPGGTYRFFCPNYDFPYEPHFGFLTIFSKKWTLKIQKKKIRKMEKERKENLQQFYDELSFPNIQKINKKSFIKDQKKFKKSTLAQHSCNGIDYPVASIRR
jgi:2-polyprenyl-3-methyl-5-hydroxy-6-metoxy-1,4-benzoquinol methylase